VPALPGWSTPRGVAAGTNYRKAVPVTRRADWPRFGSGGAVTIASVPIYEFECAACGCRFEELAPAGTENVACPECGSESTTRVYSAPGPVPKLVRTPAGNRRQEAANAKLRESTKQRFTEARRRARASNGGDS
jgi:putative FmdB family regulatory protein